MSRLSFWKTSLFSPCEDVEIIGLRGFGAPGERVALSFSVSSPEDVGLEIISCDLAGENSRIKNQHIECFVVKEWVQAGIGIYQTASQRVLELLVKDDREVFQDKRSRRCAHWKNPRHWRHFARKPKFYQAPQVRFKGNVCTLLSSDERKQIWVEAHIKADMTAGVYRGFIEVEVDASVEKIDKPLKNKGLRTERLAIEIEVLPIQLLQPEQDFFLWYKGTLSCMVAQHHVSSALFEAQLRDIHAHGFTSIPLNESCPHLLQEALDIAHKVGFCRNVMLTNLSPQDMDGLNFYDMTPVLYLSDEIDMRGEVFRKAHFEKWHAAKSHSEGSRSTKTMASLVHQSTFKQVFQEPAQGIDATPDISSYYLPDNCHYFAMRSQFAEVQNQTSYYYWLSHMEKPNLHRVLAGLWLSKSRADGIAPYCYQHVPAQGASPFDDFASADVDAPTLDPTNLAQAFKALMTTYPAAHGSIATLQWKGLSAGITDLKYLTTLEVALKNASGSSSPAIRVLASKVQQRRDMFLERLNLVNIQIRSATQSEPYEHIAPHEYVAFREQMARDIVALQEA